MVQSGRSPSVESFGQHLLDILEVAQQRVELLCISGEG